MSEEHLIDNYRLVNCLATGSCSQIWEVNDQETGERFAMKLLLEEAFKQAEMKATLKREYKIAAGLDHPNIIQVFGHVQTKKHAYMIMEHFGGPNLKQIIRGDILVIHMRLRKLVECLLMGLSHVHEKGWLHRDVKPDNIMMTKATDVRLIDFSLSSKAPSGLSKMLGGKSKTIQGTRTYIAPEIVRRKLPSAQSDLYSFGVSLYECLTGRPPFMGSSPNDLLIKHIQEPPAIPSAFNENVSTEMDKFVLRLLAKKPENRPDSASEALSEFRSVKMFNEDPEAYSTAKITKAKAELDDSVAATLDSRTDAERQQRIRDGLEVAPAPKKQAPAPAKKTEPEKKKAPQRPQQPANQPQMQPPAGWMPGQQMPGQYAPQPGQPMRGYYPQQPGQPMPGQQAPPQGAPSQGAPSQGQPNQQRQPQPKPPAPKSPPAKKPAPPAKPQVNPDDLPFADELPDFK
ncbi:protein kinase [uncultured Rubinisphaera sp.]|uniref:serine/threonine protein kinase n=1 Tax=uncultured Rubinisphaera sp. TaxID=1678686 RepID=UPI0030D8FB26